MSIRTRFTAAALLAALPVLPSPALGQDFAIRDARVFDGTRVTERATVVVRNGRIAVVGPDAPVPAGLEVVDGAGHTLLPGLIDAHTHTFTLDMLRAALMFGVTTQLDQFTPATMAAAWRREQAASGAPDRADIASASTLVTAPGGHGTQYGLPIPTIATPGEAEAFVTDRLEEGSEWIKIVRDDGSVYGLSVPTVDEPVLAAVVRAARAKDRLAVVHVGRLSDARIAVRSGASGLVHVWSDSVPEAALVEQMAQQGMFVTPTLTVIEGVTGTASGTALVADQRVAPWLPADVRANLERAFPLRSGAAASFAAARRSVAALHQAGITILAGSDAPNPGTTHGASLHRELELLVEAGLSPVDALRAATSAPALAYGLEDRGRIAAGLRADLLLVAGDPRQDITATRAVVAVWKGGHRADRTAYREQVAASLSAEIAAPATLQGGEALVSDFENDTPRATFGSWDATTDAIAGGTSRATLEIREGALLVAGEVAPGLPFAWAGAMYFPGAQPMAPANLSAAPGFSFRARGDGATYRVMVFTRRGGPIPAMAAFTAGDSWEEHGFRWPAFQTDGSDVLGIAIAAGPAPGPFELRLDDFRFR